MTEADVDSLSGNRMEETEARAFLKERGTGVLSLAREGEAYGFPVSFGYDEDADRIYFVFVGYGEESRKESFAGETTRASLCVYAADSARDWRSVVVDGAIDAVEDGWEDSRAALEDNAWYPSLFSEADPRRDLSVWGLNVESISGLRGPDAESTSE
ncbi:pyridoxamine 5'-phosphate oxidase family protein [Halobium salinum]|uniref:Pyridoxamine 5'-phosphate oxidase family protein n=1 Tax=Halobium salinum TaxID=1364940 RepID=A0ABD5PDM4_9EURY|nr:pyridoxamine 5'-phosphate oxidase family protein [Halobium salinum]